MTIREGDSEEAKGERGLLLDDYFWRSIFAVALWRDTVSRRGVRRVEEKGVEMLKN